MALGDLILDETVAMTGGVRVLPNDEPGTKVEICAQGVGTIRGVAETSMYTYTQLQRPDGSIYGEGRGIITTKDGDVIVVTATGSGKVPAPGGAIKFRTMVHVQSAPAKYADLQGIGLAGEYDVQPDGGATHKCWEWK